MTIPYPDPVVFAMIFALGWLILRTLKRLGFGLFAWIGDEFIYGWIKERRQAKKRVKRIRF